MVTGFPEGDQKTEPAPPMEFQPSSSSECNSIEPEHHTLRMSVGANMNPHLYRPNSSLVNLASPGLRNARVMLQINKSLDYMRKTDQKKETEAHITLQSSGSAEGNTVELGPPQTSSTPQRSLPENEDGKDDQTSGAETPEASTIPEREVTGSQAAVRLRETTFWLSLIQGQIAAFFSRVRRTFTDAVDTCREIFVLAFPRNRKELKHSLECAKDLPHWQGLIVVLLCSLTIRFHIYRRMTFFGHRTPARIEGVSSPDSTETVEELPSTSGISRPPAPAARLPAVILVSRPNVVTPCKGVTTFRPYRLEVVPSTGGNSPTASTGLECRITPVEVIPLDSPPEGCVPHLPSTDTEIQPDNHEQETGSDTGPNGTSVASSTPVEVVPSESPLEEFVAPPPPPAKSENELQIHTEDIGADTGLEVTCLSTSNPVKVVHFHSAQQEIQTPRWTPLFLLFVTLELLAMIVCLVLFQKHCITGACLP